MSHKTTIEIFTPADNMPLPDEVVVFAVEDVDIAGWFTGGFDGDHWRTDDFMPLNEPVLFWFYPPNPEQFASGG